MTRLCLVVEDESPLGEMICDNLQSEGFSTELVKDGETGQVFVVEAVQLTT